MSFPYRSAANVKFTHGDEGVDERLKLLSVKQ